MSAARERSVETLLSAAAELFVFTRAKRAEATLLRYHLFIVFNSASAD